MIVKYCNGSMVRWCVVSVRVRERKRSLEIKQDERFDQFQASPNNAKNRPSKRSRTTPFWLYRLRATSTTRTEKILKMEKQISQN